MNTMNLEDAMELATYINEQGWVAMDHLAALARGEDITDLVEAGEFAVDNIDLIDGVLQMLESAYGVDTSEAQANLATFDREAWEADNE